jgi:predicted transcriptional regulator YdeE
MFKIGDFSKLSRVPVKTLRYYDEIGLLRPIGVDRFTRYRYYDLDQLPLLYRILGLKELGFSLEQIGQLLDGEISQDQLVRMLRKRQLEIKAQMEQESQLLQRIETRLKTIEQSGQMPEYEILIKKVEPQWVASICTTTASYAEFETLFDRLFGELYHQLHLHGVRITGHPLAIYHDVQNDGENIRIEACVGLAGPVSTQGQFQIYELAGAETMASVVHQGAFETIGRAYSAILSWRQANDARIVGPTRELYLRLERNSEHKQTIVEIQFPVKFSKEVVHMEPKIVDVDKFYIVGLPYIGKNEHQEISQMWGVFNQRCIEIRHVLHDQPAYGICYSHPSGMEYIAAFPVSKLEDIPEGMVGKEVPAQTYVVFAVQGLEEIGLTYHKIMSEWLPASGYQPGDGPDFELYGEEFDPQSSDGLLYIYFPIKRG